MALLGQRSDVGEFRRRYRWLVLAAIVMFLILVLMLLIRPSGLLGNAFSESR